MSLEAQEEPLLEHMFRRQAGRMVASLTRALGPQRLDLAEEAVQEAMLRALQCWPSQGVPPNAPAWLFRTAHNAAIDAVRRKKFTAELTDALVCTLSRSAANSPGDPVIDEQLRDDELSMIFMCCHPEIPPESRVALSLKTVGGFNVREIARAFLADDAAIAQRLVRAKRLIRDQRLTLDLPEAKEAKERLASVLSVIYFLFNEGYAAHEGDELIRADLCEEAIRLGRLVAASSLATPEVHALVALMAFQAARSPARVDAFGDLILLDHQDRSLWDQKLISLGFKHFKLSIAGDEVTRFHMQAAIAATHARATDTNFIDWQTILQLYDQLQSLDPSPVVALNRAVAVAKVHGPAQALATIEPLQEDPKMRGYYLLLALRGHLLFQLGRAQEAAATFQAALLRRCSEPERRFLQRKLSDCEG